MACPLHLLANVGGIANENAHCAKMLVKWSLANLASTTNMTILKCHFKQIMLTKKHFFVAKLVKFVFFVSSQSQLENEHEHTQNTHTWPRTISLAFSHSEHFH